MQGGAHQWHHSGTKFITTTECRGYGQLVLVRHVYELSTLTMKALLIILPKRSLTESRQCRESER